MDYPYAWQSREEFVFQGQTYGVCLYVDAPSERYTPDYKRSLPYMIIVEANEDPKFEWLRVRHHHVDGKVGEGPYAARFYNTKPIGSYRLSEISSLEEGAHVEVFLYGDNITFATWENRDGKLVRV